jgi:hypothetical protein
MIQRAALFAASLAATLSLAVGFVLAGFTPTAPPADAGQAAPAVEVADPTAAPTIKVDTVYVTAPVKPVEVTVRTASVSRGGEEDEHEGGDDD